MKNKSTKPATLSTAELKKQFRRVAKYSEELGKHLSKREDLPF